MTAVADALALLDVRLARHGLDTPEFALPESMVELVDGLPDWWQDRGNHAYGPPGTVIPGVGPAPDGPPPTGAVLVLAAAVLPAFMLWGEAPLVVLGVGTRFPAGWLCCGGGSTIAIGADTGSTWSARVDARNGGAVSVGGGGIWAAGAVVQTDDMHAIRDLATGARINPHGGTVSIARHVWLGHEALVLPGARIGADTMVGARALVAGPLPANAVCVGIPARAIRRDVTWAFEDLP